MNTPSDTCLRTARSCDPWWPASWQKNGDLIQSVLDERSELRNQVSHIFTEKNATIHQPQQQESYSLRVQGQQQGREKDCKAKVVA